MITVTLSGPNQAAITSLARRLMTTLQVEGKVVRLYPEAEKAPDVIPQCDVVIIIEQENNHDR